LARLDSGRPGRVTLAIMNTYDRRVLREPHRRAIARAGAVAAAFEANLALFGFPLPDGVRTPTQLAEWASGTTTIGQDAAYFVETARAGRVSIFGEIGAGFPPQLGTPIATTSKPRAGKSVALGALGERIAGGESVLLVFGLGPHGLPPEVRHACSGDFDVTVGGYSLETATAIGAVTAAVWYAAKKPGPARERPRP
jgi:hypothetical protein